jgi:gliding motility-associated-like protein
MKNCIRFILLLAALSAAALSPQQGRAQCPTIEAILIDACGDEGANEFVIINSGGGFNTSNIQMDFDFGNNAFSPLNNDINTNNGNDPTNPTPCGLTVGNPGVYSGCTNFIPVGPGVDIPANSIVVLQTSSSPTSTYNFSALCGMGECVYIIANSCARTIGGFTNAGTGTRTTTFSIAGGCSQVIIYDRSQLSGADGDYFLPLSNTYGNNGCAVPPTSAAPMPSLPTLTPIGPFCANDAPAGLSTTQDGILGSWSGTGVTGGNTFSPATAGSGTFTLTFTPNAGQCANANTLNVTVSPVSTPALTPIGPFCITAAAVPLGTTQSGITGNWSGSGVAANSFNPATAGAGSHTLTFTPNPGQCADPNTLTVTVNASATPTFAPIGPFCQFSTPPALPTTSSNGVTGQWAPASIFTGLPGTQTYIFTPTAGQCAEVITIDITILASATATFAPIGPFCVGDAAPALPTTSQNGIEGSWSPAVISTAAPGTTTYTFTPNPGSCGTGTTLNITVNSPTAPSFAPIGPLCQGDAPPALPATSQNGISGTWNPAAINTATAGTFTYTFTPSPGQCASTNTLSITVNPATTPALTPIGPFCQADGPTALNTTQSGISGTWSGPGVSGGNSFSPSAAGSGTFTLTFTPGAGQCANANTLSVTVNPATTPALTPIGPYCQNDAPAALNTTQSGISGTWSGPGVSGGNNFSPSAAGSGTFTLTFTPGAGLCANANTLSVTVNPTPVANPAGPLTQCGASGGTATFNLTSLNNTISGGAGTVSWFTNPAATNPVPNPAAYTTGSTTVYATVTSGSCTSAPTAVALSVEATLMANTPSIPFTVCYSLIPFNYTENLDEVVNQINGGTGLEVLWYVDAAGNTPLDLLDPNVILQLITNGWNPIYAAITDGSCTSPTVPVGVALSTFPTAAPQALSACGTGGTAAFNLLSLDNAVSSGSGTVSWFTDLGANNPIFTPDFYVSGPATVYAVVTNAVGCNSNPAPVSLFVNPQPSIDPQGDATVCGMYTLPAITGSNLTGAQAYYTGPSGSGAMLSAGDQITSSQAIYIYDSAGPGCSDEQVFVVTISPPPAIDPIPDVEACAAYTLPTISGTNLSGFQGYYTEPGGGGGLLFSGEQIASTQFVYAYDGLPGCESEQAFLVTINQPPSLLLEAASPISCNGAADGSLNLAVSGGTPNFQYDWNVNALDGTQNPAGLGAGSYAVTVTDGAGCQSSAAIALSEPAAIQANCNVTNPILTPGGSEGEASISFSGGTGPYNISWAGPVSGAGTSPTPGLVLATNLVAGTYVATIQDGNDCEETCTFTLGAPDTSNCTLALNLIVFQEEGCPGSNDGIIALGVFNAVQPFSILWEDGTEDEQIRIGLSAGVYSVTVTDSDSCVATASVTMGSSFPLIEAVITPSADTVCQDDCVSFDLAFSGVPPFQLIYEVDTGMNAQAIFFQTDSLTSQIEVCPADFRHSSGPLEVRFIQLQDLNCAIPLGQLEIIQTIPSDTSFVTAQSCDPAQAGIDTLVLQNSFGCDSVLIVETVFDPDIFDLTFLAAQSCDPAQVGIDTVLLQNSVGCDSLVITETVLLPSDTIFLTAESCDPAQAGTDTLVLQNSFGCDSLVITETVLLPADTVFLTVGNCDPAQAGIDTIALQNSLGCDSLVITETVLLPSDTVFLSAQSCNPAQVGIDTVLLQNSAGCDSLVITETIFDPAAIDFTFLSAQSCDPAQVGVDTVVLQNSFGCDSLVITTTVLLPADTVFLTAESCDPAQVGIDTVLLQNSVGCDSLVITETVLLPSDTVFLAAESCDPAQVGTDTLVLQNSFGCDSLVITTTVLLPSDTFFLTAESCDPAQVGTDTLVLQNSFGCDSLVITTTVLLPSDTVFLTAESCDPAEVGIDTVLLQNSFGCDSLVITETVLLPSDTVFLTAESCDPAEVGIDTVLLQNSFGCDSLVITTTVLLPADTVFLTAESCDPAQVGTDTLVLQNSLGCDSLVITTTVLLPADTVFLTAESCDPAQVGTDTLVLQNSLGCDSLVITTTALLPADTVFLTAESCDPAQVGTDTLVLQNSLGCDSLVITTTALLPADTVFLTAESCDPAQVGTDTLVLQNSLGCDSLVITTTALLPADTVFLTAESCDPAQVGTDTLVLQNSFGCDSLVITQTVLLPTDTAFLAPQLCPGETLSIAGITFSEGNPSGTAVIPGGAANGCDSVVAVSLSFFPPAIGQVAEALCSGESLLVNGQRYDEDNPAGTEVIVGGSINGCDSIVQVTLSFLATPAGSIEGAAAICPGETVELTLRLTGAAAFNVELSDGRSFLNVSDGHTFLVSPLATTAYEIVVLTAVGSLCPVEIGPGATVSVSALAAQAAVSTDYGGFGISCDGSADGGVQASATGGIPPLSYLWDTGATSAALSNLGAGAYTVTVTDGAGCASQAQAVLSAPPPIVVQASGQAPNCLDDRSGSILVERIEGGAAPFEYSLDGQFFASLGDLPFAIPALPAGSYQLTVQDVNDCQAQLQIGIPAALELTLDLGPDRTIKLGDSTRLQPQANFAIADFAWSPAEGLSDPAVLAPHARPAETVVYTLTARDSAGCSAADAITIFVDKKLRVYAPNAFSPNGDGNNDFFTLFAGPEVRQITLFRIFDRWGNQLFEAGPLQPNQPTLGWDGTFRGSPMGPGVYVFYAEVEFVDGVTELVKGEVLLLR